MTYQHFANFYDQLMNDVPYHLWLEYLAERVNPENQTILDIGCGTGSLSIPLAKQGFQVTGLDLSAEMLAIADEKARNEKVNVQFIQQDMTDLSNFEPDIFDVIICFCDSLNYVLDEQDVLRTFKGVRHVLKPNGLFMFDVHSVEKVDNIFKNQTFVSTENDVSFIWNCFEGEYPHSVDHELTFFIQQPEQGLYQRFDEIHSQRTFSIEEYTQLVTEAGFTKVEITSDFNQDLESGERERIFFSCYKK
ncbi:ubiquinone/menaquinone biosynthesis C-methylase UbiE [Bacillus mesophilus]|uniref:Class I SAM-dependent methyltransferase n=1 Tax=Bacillus mesophilus TaxID=1808955 RepID=A0A6M0Q7G1_9BACI|nr:class I SAM-dependent methyltransferase [Bacillus mesophilus]MBM7660764.1 ubiquinone/menaquinone biosynthesis C-methylase UbiE [Bacillus mesophilus]NEY71689.1 class I SAM-dependent methyltransferase [Bacillus mesophilus]